MTVHEALAKLRVLMENAIGGRRTLNDHKTWLRRDQERLNGYWDALDALVAHVDTLTRERDEAEKRASDRHEVMVRVYDRAEAAEAALADTKRALRERFVTPTGGCRLCDDFWEGESGLECACGMLALAAGDTEETT